MDTANDTPLFGGDSSNDVPLFGGNDNNNNNNNNYNNVDINNKDNNNNTYDDMFEFNIGYSGNENNRRKDSFEIHFNNNMDLSFHSGMKNNSTNNTNSIIKDRNSINSPITTTTNNNEAHIKKLTKHAHMVGKNLEHMAWELKEYLNDTTKKSALNFNLVTTDLEGLESIVQAGIKGNKKLIEKHIAFRQKLITAKKLHKQITELKECVDVMHTLSVKV